MKLSRYLLTLALCAAVFGAVACSNSSDSLVSSNESDGLASLDDGKKDFFTWDNLIQVFDAKADLPSCDKFEGVAQVVYEKGFFACFEDEWMPIGASVPTYDQLPKCNAAMNNFCVDVTGGEDVDASYICDEGKWVKGRKIEGSELCTKTDENSIEIEHNVSCMVKSNEFIGVQLGDRWVGRGEVLSENANCKVLTFDDGKKRCDVEVNDYDCDGEWNDGTCDVEGFCMHVEEPSLPEIEEPCLTPLGLRLNCYKNEKREMECITESYGGEDGIMKNGVCVVDEKKLNKELEKKLQAMQEKFEKEMQDLDDKYEKEMQDLDDKYEKEMQDLKNEYEKEKQALIDEYERRKRGE